MNLEPKIESKVMWWDGHYGGMTKDGNFLMMYIKPTLTFIGSFDEVLCTPAHPTNKALNYVVNGGSQDALSSDEIKYIESLIDISIPSAGGGGGGSDPRAIVAIEASSPDPTVTLTRADGSRSITNFAPTIQNTPAYSLLINNQGYNKSAHCNMVAGDGDKNGVKCLGKGVPMEMPVWMYDKGGTKLGGDYDPDTGHLYIGADEVEVNWQLAFHIGVHPDWPKYAQGRPKGNYSVLVIISHRRESDGEWVDVIRHPHNFSTHTGDYPNTAHINFNSAGTVFITSGLKSGWYRISYAVQSFGDDPSIIPYIRLGAVSNGFLTGNSATHYFQARGSIKATAGGESINPIPRP